MNREELLIKYKEPIKVGQSGFVQLIDIMGDDSAIVQAARTSYGEGTKTVSTDRDLIRYLIRNSHTSPIEMCEIKLCIQAPIYVFRQMLRHRTASVNEYSLRYSESLDLYELTKPNEWRTQNQNNKQGSSGFIPIETDGFLNSDHESKLVDKIATEYKALIHMGVAREQARKILPLSTYSRCYWKIDLQNLLHFIALRMDSHAQQEIRDFANVIWDIVRDWVPATAMAFEDYSIEAMTLSRPEIEAFNWIHKNFDIREFHTFSSEEIRDVLQSCSRLSKSERIDFVHKLKHLFREDSNE